MPNPLLCSNGSNENLTLVKDNVLISHSNLMELLNTTAMYIERLRAHRGTHKQPKLDKAQKIVKEMMFVSRYNPSFRQDTYRPLKQLLDEMYIEMRGN